MKHYLDNLMHIPGVRAAGFVSPDGFSLVWAMRESNPGEDALDTEALSALACSWQTELSRSAAPLSWSAPKRAVLRATRGTLILACAPQLILVVVLEGGTSHEELRLPMESSLARVARHLKHIGHGDSHEHGAPLPRQQGPSTGGLLGNPAAQVRQVNQSAPSGE